MHCSADSVSANSGFPKKFGGSPKIFEKIHKFFVDHLTGGILMAKYF